MSPKKNIWQSWWWGLENAEAAGQALCQTVDALKNEHQPRIELLKALTRNYRARDCSGFAPTDWMSSTGDALGTKLTYNVTRSCIDTVVGQMTISEPMASFGTFGGDMEKTQRARGMQKLSAGVIQLEEAWDRIFPGALRDACIGSFGCVKTILESGRIRLLRRHPARILWDQALAVDSEPSSYYELLYPSKAWLLAHFPAMASQIAEMPRFGVGGTAGTVERDIVEVIEAYHPPMGSAPGRRLLAGPGVVFAHEAWEDRAPYEFIKWGLGDDVLGFDAISLAEELRGHQEELDFCLEKARRNLENVDGFWLKHKGSEIDDEELLSNEPGREVEWNGSIAPQWVTPQPVHPQLLQWIESIYRRSFEVSGVSEYSATSRKPADLESGAALRAHQEVSTIRLSPVAKNYAGLVVKVCGQITRCARRAAKADKGWSVRYMGPDRTLQQVKWSEVALEQDQFAIMRQPMSAFPLQPAARMERVSELARDQVIDKSTYLWLMKDAPDLEEYFSLATAPLENYRRLCEVIISTGKRIRPPDAIPQPELGIQVAMGYWSRGHVDGTDQSRLDLLESFAYDLAKIIAKAQAGAAPQGGQAGQPVVPVEQAAAAPVTPAPPPLGPMGPGTQASMV